MLQDGPQGTANTYLLLPTLLGPSSPRFSDKAGVRVQRGENGSKSPQEIPCSAPNEQRDTTSDSLLIIAAPFACGEADIVISTDLRSQAAKN